MNTVLFWLGMFFVIMGLGAIHPGLGMIAMGILAVVTAVRSEANG